MEKIPERRVTLDRQGKPLKSILRTSRPHHPYGEGRMRKKIQFPPDTTLVRVQVFATEEGERANVARDSFNRYQKERQLHQEEGRQLSLGYIDDALEDEPVEEPDQIPWYHPATLILPPAVPITGLLAGAQEGAGPPPSTTTPTSPPLSHMHTSPGHTGHIDSMAEDFSIDEDDSAFAQAAIKQPPSSMVWDPTPKTIIPWAKILSLDDDEDW
jgi:hypothetical protein